MCGMETYHQLAREKRWTEAAALIQLLIGESPQEPVLWFYWGVCLAALDHPGLAAVRFKKAYELNPADESAQFQVFQSLFDAGDFDGLLEFTEAECSKNPVILKQLLCDSQFGLLFDRSEFRALLSRFPLSSNRTSDG